VETVDLVQPASESMAKQKERSELETLRAENRKLKSENRHLKKEVSRSKKREHLHQDLEEKMAEEYLEEDVQEDMYVSNDKCPKCPNKLDAVDIGVRVLYTCECGYRKSKKK
jgi:hypothetical protein